MPRLFFGLEVPSEITDRLLKVRSAVPGAKWQSAGQLHITLLFLGMVSQEDLEALAGSARDIKSEPFLLDVAGVGCFGQSERPKNLWAGVQPEAPVAALNKALGVRMETLGFGAERRVFRPHITLARFKRKAGSVEPLLVEYGDSRFGQFQVTEFVLFESKPGPTGSVYSVIERFPLRTGG
ncbi:RNA 2',3'-cyclic phosphodiesterase [Marinobacter sp. BW6]|uniref:RNA 2',3'-cyclic phosphodiesterase n=1 Tax=Marinobacter sp. BW6 TaxID=2592624 RepID=UPI0011DEDE69|nr:RNA 2',3'-cyclic phosphodiesterase [Marinobacter sp. BW6]TYC59264.1 RNA 2',3'-cyclic phosphodiesterase [Marinobacter sp. BW6]